MSLIDHKYPYTNFHELNLDWIIKRVLQFQDEAKAAAVEALQTLGLATITKAGISKIDGTSVLIDSDGHLYVDYSGAINKPVINGKTIDGIVSLADIGAASQSDYMASVAIINQITQNLATQTARIDEIIALPEGSTTGDAELADIRVAADGTVYSTAGNAVRGQISALNKNINALNNKIFDVNDVTSRIDSIISVEPFINYSGGTNGSEVTLASNSSFDSYAIYIQEDCTIYVPNTTGIAYYALTRLKNPSGTWTEGIEFGVPVKKMSGTDGIRYRNTEGNLPDISNKLSVKQGDLIVFTFTKNTVGLITFVSIHTNDLTNVIKLNNGQLSQVQNDMLFKYDYIDSTHSEINIYIPMSDGYYLGQKLVKTIIAPDAEAINKNSNVWKLDTCSVYTKESDSMNIVVPDIVIPGAEYELALQLSSGIFIGGLAHGHEVYNDFKLLINGKTIQLGANSFETWANKIDIISVSRLNDPNNLYDYIADHLKHWSFNNGIINVKQSVKFLKDIALYPSYTLMLPIKRMYTDYAIRKYGTVIEDIRTSGHSIIYTSDNEMYYSLYSNNIICNVNFKAAGRYTGYSFISNSAEPAYNKLYYSFLPSGGVNNVNANDVFEIEFNIKYSYAQ